MARFIAFVSSPAEAEAHARAHPGHEHAFASFADLGDRGFKVDPADDEPFLDRVAAEHRRAPFLGVLNRKEKCLLPAARLADRLGVRPIIDDPLIARDKHRMRLALNGDAPGPRSLLLRGEADLAAAGPDCFPGVLKPRFGFNSRAVVLVRDHAELVAAFRQQHPAYAALPKQDGTNADFVLEDLIPGTEHTIDVLVADGVGRTFLVSDKDAMRPPHFVEIGDRAPSRLSAADLATVREAASVAIRRLGIRNGWSHVEVRLQAGRAVTIEAAARMGGGYFEQLTLRAWGIDRMAALIDLHLGLPLPGDAPRQHVVGRRVLVNGVRWVALRRGAAACARPGVQLVWPASISAVRRIAVGPPHDFKNTLLEYVVGADTPAGADRLADTVEAEATPLTLPLPAALLRLAGRLPSHL